MKILLVIGGIIFFIYSFMTFLKIFYSLLSIKKVYIPLFYDNKHLFKNDDLVNKLKSRKNLIYLLTTLFFITISILAPAACDICILSFLLAFIASKLTFNARIFENNFIHNFKNYLKENIDE